MIEYRKKYKQITYNEYWKVTKNMNSLEKALSPYHRKIKVDDLLHDEYVGIREYIRLMDKRYEEAEKTVSDPDDFEYFVEDGMDMIIMGSKDMHKRLMEAIKNKKDLPLNATHYPISKPSTVIYELSNFNEKFREIMEQVQKDKQRGWVIYPETY